MQEIYLVGTSGRTVTGVIGPYAKEEEPFGTANGKRTLTAQGARELYRVLATSTADASEKVRKELRKRKELRGQ